MNAAEVALFTAAPAPAHRWHAAKSQKTPAAEARPHPRAVLLQRPRRAATKAHPTVLLQRPWGAAEAEARRARSTRIAGVPEIARRYAADANWLAETHVGEGAAIGAGAVILPCLSIGPNAMVAAGAVVTADVAAHELVSGNPARRTGYVGRSGMKLRKTGDDTWECPDTGNRFRATGDGLEKRGP